jgi:polyisoprenoid-binding protein YceI
MSADPGLPGDWAADLTASTVTFTVRNFKLRTVTGRMPLTGAVVTVGPGGRPVGIRAELDPGRINTGNRRRDQDLRGPRFLDADRWPAITFEASTIRPAQAGWTVEGTLTVKDTRCPVRLDVTAPGRSPGDLPAPVDLRATGRLDRRSAGVSAGPAFLIGHTISLTLAVRLSPPAGVQARREDAARAIGG